MGLFVVISTGTTPTALEAPIKQTFPSDYLQIGPNEWLVSGKGIAKEISEKLDIGSGLFGNAVVFAISGYWGIANNSVWEWIALKTATVVKDASA